MVAGGFDYLLKTRVRDMAAYRASLGGVLLGLPGMRETRTCAVLAGCVEGPLQGTTDVLPYVEAARHAGAKTLREAVAALTARRTVAG